MAVYKRGDVYWYEFWFKGERIQESLPEGADEMDYVRALQGRGDVEFAELDRIVPVSDLIPNDALYSSEWHLPRIAAPAAWSITTGSSGVIIAIIDTGVDGTPDVQHSVRSLAACSLQVCMHAACC